MFRKPFFLHLFTMLSIASLLGCEQAAPASKIITSPTAQSQVLEITTVGPSPSPGQLSAPTSAATQDTIPAETEPVTEDEAVVSTCETMGNIYEHNQALGEINASYIGSWLAAPMVGSAYNERFVFFSSGNYLYFPSQYECEAGGENCTPSPIEEGIWGVHGSLINLAKGGEIAAVRSIAVGEVIEAPADESPYPFKTDFDGTTYWLLSPDTNLWDPVTGELCE